LGILNLASRFDKPSLENACQQGLAAQLLSYREIKGLLETQCADSAEGLAAHDNIRGEKYYQ
jgi:hypothetical protein